MNDKSRWINPQAWLEYRTGEANATVLKDLVMALAYKMSSDQLTDLFRDDMAADGYFQDLERRA